MSRAPGSCASRYGRLLPPCAWQVSTTLQTPAKTTPSFWPGSQPSPTADSRYLSANRAPSRPRWDLTTTIVSFSHPLPGDEDGPQLSALRTAGATRVFAPPATATAWNRSALEEWVRQMAPGDTLIVTDLSRLSPSLAHFVFTIAQLDERGIVCRSLAEPALSADPSGATMMPADVLRGLDLVRHRLRSARTREGTVTAAASGRRPGRPTVMTSERVAMPRGLFAPRVVALRRWVDGRRVGVVLDRGDSRSALMPSLCNPRRWR